MASSGDRDKTRRRRFWSLCGLAALALMATGCLGTVRVRTVEARLMEDGEAVATLSHRGPSQVLVRAGDHPPAWSALLLDNGTLGPIRDLRLWDSGLTSLIQLAPGTEPDPFGLLPGERLLVTGEESSRLRSSFLWQLPADARAVKGSIDMLNMGRVEPGRGVVLEPGGAGWAQFLFAAPFEHEEAWLGWSSDPPRALDVYISHDGFRWVRLRSPPSRIDPWLDPVDISANVSGERRFRIRLITAPDVEEEVLVTGVRLERSGAGGGRFQSWRPGLNSIHLSFDGPKGARLKARLIER